MKSEVVEYTASRMYPTTFKMVIEDVDGVLKATSFLGYSAETGFAGFTLVNKGDGTGYFNLADNYALDEYNETTKRFYGIYVYNWDTGAYEDELSCVFNEDGTITIGNFYIMSTQWNEDDQAWGAYDWECQYYNNEATKTEEGGVEGVALDSNAVKAVYSLDGTCLGNSTEGLAKGIYVIRGAGKTSKVLVK